MLTRMGRTRFTAMFVLLCSLIGLSLGSTIHSANLSPADKSEIEHLLAYIEKSGCRFYRNGTWYNDPKAAREHVEKKYEYFLKKGKITSAEDFITWAATKSEISGRPYKVQCGTGPAEPFAPWLTAELNRYRKQKQANSLG